MNAAESIADVLELLAQRNRCLKDSLAYLEKEQGELRRELGVAIARGNNLSSTEEQLRRLFVQVRHQRDMARLALTDIHSRAALFRDDAENGRVEGGEAWLAVLGHTTRGLTLSAQDDQPKEEA